MGHGRPVSIASGSADQTRTAVASQGGDATMAPDGLTFGKLVDGGRVGKLHAMYRKVSGQAGVSIYRLPHDLGHVPAWAQLVRCENTTTPNTVLTASTINLDKWTASEIQVCVFASMGNVAGSEMWFMIGGER